MKQAEILVVLIFSFAGPIMATDETRQTAFFDSVQAGYLREYQACTGDMSFVPSKDLLQWKEQMNALAVSKEYLDLLKEYRRVDTTGNVLPCRVLAWNRKRKELQALHEDTLSRDLLAREELESAENEAGDLAKSPYDLPGLPFGLSKKSLLLIFKNNMRVPFVDEGNYIYVNNMAWGSRTFLTAFYFDKTGLYFKYEIEGPSLTADRVNSTVRPDAEYLSHELAGRFGEPSRRYSIGFFDIKSGVLCPYKTWDAAGFDVYVGLSMNKYRYYAKAVIAAHEIRKPGAQTDSSEVRRRDTLQ
jgi:hypothetical protein